MMKLSVRSEERAADLGRQFAGLQAEASATRCESWFVMQAVADSVQEASNTGYRGITWSGPGASAKKSAGYALNARTVDAGRVNGWIKAPKTPDEALTAVALQPAIDALERLIENGGGRITLARPSGTRDALVKALAASEEGRKWLAARSYKTACVMLSRMVSVADSYGRAGVNPEASLSAHVVFITNPDRAVLIRECPSEPKALRKVAEMRRGDATVSPAAGSGFSNMRVSPKKAKLVARRSGVTETTAKTIYRAVMSGESEDNLLRAVRASIKIHADQTASVA